MHLHTLSPPRLTGTAALVGAAALACAAALIPVAALAATSSPAPATVPGAPAVPAAFQPVWASFQSPARGFVLGAAGCRHPGTCRARLVATADGSARWHFVSVPDVRLFNDAGNLLTQEARVSGVVFASRRDGWLYGPGLYATHDGGRLWRRIILRGNIVPRLGGGVVAMAASGGIAYAVVSPDPFHGKPDELYASPAGTNTWARVGTMTGDPFASLAVSGTAAWFGTSTRLWATTDGGARWHKYPFRCPGARYGLDGLAAASRSHLAFACTNPEGMFRTDKAVLRSADGGRTEHLAGYAPAGGDTNGQIAEPPHRGSVITIAVITPGPSYLYRSADGGKTWAQIAVPGTGGGVNLGSLSYVSPTVGWVVAGGAPLPGSGNRLLRTTDAGRSWHPVTF